MAHQAVKRPLEETLSLWKREQARLKALVVDWDTETWQRDPTFSGLQRVGGVDVSFVKGDSVRACASLVVLSFPELEVVYEDSRMVSLTAPYVSGFLAFREVPFLMELVQRLQEKEPSLMPQVVLVDGNGVLHQRGFGVACHLGVLTELPCIGVAKKLLQVDGLENNALHKEKIRLLQAGGNTFPLMGSSGTVLGMALKSHDHSTKPLYISVGHRTSLEAAVRLTYRCCRFRVPEPVRQADIRSREYIRRTVGQPESPAPGEESIGSQERRPAACSQAGPEAPAGQGRPPDVTAEALAQMQKALSQAPRNSRRTSNEAAGRHEDSVTSLRGCSLGTPQPQVAHQAPGVTCENPQQDAADSPAWAGCRPPLPALAQQRGHCATAGSHSTSESTPSHPECMKACL